MCDLLEQSIVDVTIDPLAVVQRERGRQGKACKVRSWVDVVLAPVAVDEHLFDTLRALVVDDGHVTLHRRAVKSSGRRLASSLTALIPG